jgi:hypothetical protein
VRATLGAGVSVEMADLTPAALATLKHAASMPNPAFYDRQRRRFSTWGIPGSCTAMTRPSTASWCCPSLADVVATVIEEAGSKIVVADDRALGEPQQFGFAAALRDDQASALAYLTDHELGSWSHHPARGRR